MYTTGLEVSDKCPDEQRVDKVQHQLVGVFCMKPKKNALYADHVRPSLLLSVTHSQQTNPLSGFHETCRADLHLSSSASTIRSKIGSVTVVIYLGARILLRFFSNLDKSRCVI